MDVGDSNIFGKHGLLYVTCYNNVAPDPAEGIRIHIWWAMLYRKSHYPGLGHKTQTLLQNWVPVWIWTRRRNSNIQKSFKVTMVILSCTQIPSIKFTTFYNICLKVKWFILPITIHDYITQGFFVSHSDLLLDCPKRSPVGTGRKFGGQLDEDNGQDLQICMAQQMGPRWSAQQKKHDIGWSWNSEPLFMGWFRNVQNSASVSTRWKYTCWTLSYKMISIHTLRQLNSLLWKPWPMKAHGWLIISITITHGKLLDCRGDQSIHINSNYDRLGEATFEKGRETATSPSLFILLFLTLCHTQMTKQANKHFTICINLYANIMRYVYIYIHNYTHT